MPWGGSRRQRESSLCLEEEDGLMVLAREMVVMVVVRNVAAMEVGRMQPVSFGHVRSDTGWDGLPWRWPC